jgi:dTDP-4-amino-4,6-dideoxygalactose transaminase
MSDVKPMNETSGTKDLKTKIQNFLNELREEHALFPYIYNSKLKDFNQNKDWVYYSGPVWDDEETVAAIETFIAGKWLPSGEKVALFEAQYSRKYGYAGSVMVNSGSSANLVMVTALKKFLGWKDGDEIAVSTVGFPTTVAPLIQNNLTPKFVDIAWDDLNFDLDLVEKSIGPKTKAIFISPVLGNAPDMDRLKEIAAAKKVQLVLDGCDSLGSKWDGKDLGTYAVATSCSFYPAHHITTGEGGMVSAYDAEFIKLARSLAWWGRDCYCVGSANLLKDGTCRKRFSNWLPGYDGVIDHKYLFSNVGYNLKPLDMQGAIGLSQLKKMDAIHTRRRELKEKIGSLFEKHVPGTRIPGEHAKAETSWFGVPVVCETAALKEKLVNHLETNRVQTRNYFAGNILLHPGYREYGNAKDFPIANQVLDRVFFVGCHPTYTPAVISYIEDVLGGFRI